MHRTHFDVEKMQKQAYFKPLMLFYNTLKLIEQTIKNSKQKKILFIY